MLTTSIPIWNQVTRTLTSLATNLSCGYLSTSVAISAILDWGTSVPSVGITSIQDISSATSVHVGIYDGVTFTTTGSQIISSLKIMVTGFTTRPACRNDSAGAVTIAYGTLVFF